MKENGLDAIPQSRSTFDSLRWQAFTAVISAIYLFLNLFRSLRFPYLLGGDQIYFWMGAQRMLSGQAIYRDFFQCTPPGTDLIYAAGFKIFGETIWVTNAVALVLGVLSGCLCFSLARRLMKNAYALLATALYLVFIYGKFLNATHHWFAVFFILLAVRVSMGGVTTGRMAWSGTLLGLASFFNHVHSAAALFAFVIYLLLSGMRKHEERVHMAKSASALVLTFAAAALCLYAYYLGTVGFAQIWSCLVEAVSRYAREVPWSLGLPRELRLSTLPGLLPYLAVYILLPSVYSFALWKCWRFRDDVRFPWNEVTLLSLTGLSLLLEVAVSINVLRLFAIAMPGIVLLVWMAGRLHRGKEALLVAASVVVTVSGAYQTIEKHAVNSARGELPGGWLATTPEAFGKLRLLAQHTHQGEFLLQAGWPGVYLPLRVQNPLYLPTLTRWDPGYDKDMGPAIRELETKQVRFVLWTHHLDEGCGFSACADDLSPVRAYLIASFRPMQAFSDGDVLWQRVESGALEGKGADVAGR
jgi:hypothetical protein